MATHPLAQLAVLGQSPWHDNIRRSLLTSGALRKMVQAGDITGLTSNPTIFEQAIAGSPDYDDQIAKLARLKAERDPADLAVKLKALTGVAETGAGNLLEAAVHAARAKATVGEISAALEAVFKRHSAEAKERPSHFDIGVW